MNNKSIFSITLTIAVVLAFRGTESIISYELAPPQNGDMKIEVQNQRFNSSAPLNKGYAYQLPVKIEGMNHQEVTVVSSANTPNGTIVANGSRLIDSSFDTKTTYVDLIGNHSIDVNLFNTCGFRLDGAKVCENTIMEGELVLLNFNAISK